MTHCWADESAEIFLAPLSELFSYTPRESGANVIIDYRDQSVAVLAKDDLPAGTKLFANLGEIGSAEYLWKWGAIDHSPTEDCTKGSPADTLQLEPELVFETCLSFGNMEEDPLSEEKVELLQEIGMLMDFFEIERTGVIPNDLLLCVKVLFMDKDEFALYKTEMINAGFLMDGEEDDEESIEFGEEGDDITGDQQENTEIKNEELEEEEEDLPEDDEEAQILPEIKNEKEVFQALINIAEQKLEAKKDTDASTIEWEKPGVIRKPTLVSTYLKAIEKDILEKFIAECKKDHSPKTTSTKRKLSDAEQPPTKKKKTT